jgi:hypothetical protein
MLLVGPVSSLFDFLTFYVFLHLLHGYRTTTGHPATVAGAVAKLSALATAVGIHPGGDFA